MAQERKSKDKQIYIVHMFEDIWIKMTFFIRGKKEWIIEHTELGQLAIHVEKEDKLIHTSQHVD